jgi:hypothetical protein
MGTANRNIIVVPCIVKAASYACAPRIDASGCASCSRTRSPSIPASRKNTKPVTMYRIPTALWFTWLIQPMNPGGRSHVRWRSALSGAAMVMTGQESGDREQVTG